METKRETTIYRVSTLGKATLLLCMGMLAGCASSGDVEKARQERTQAKAKMSAELQQERKLAQSMEKESEARKAEADKLAKALGGKSQAPLGAPLRGTASSITLSQAVTNYNNGQCQLTIPANPPVVPKAITALHIASGTPCQNVTVGTSDATFTAQAPLVPVVVGSGGTLFIQDQPMTLYASSFLIRNGGTMQAGNPGAHVQNQITIAMAGNASAAPPPTTGDQNPNMRDITVMDGGVLALYGGKGLSGNPDNLNNNPAKSPAFINTLYGTKSWTYLATPAGPAKYNAQNGETENVSAPTPVGGDTMLALATQVDWQVGDWISVATTSFSSHQTEVVQICGISTAMTLDPHAAGWGMPLNVSYLTLCSKLKHYHYGGLVPTPGLFPAGTKQVVAKGGNTIDVGRQAKSFYDDHERNYGIDERAEVALLSRNIKLTSVAGQTTDANNFIGGHLVAMVSSATAAMPTLQLVGVEIEKFGQGLVGRYPVHLHKLPEYPITGAANAADGNIAITSSTVPANGTLVTISGVQGDTAANGRSWFVTNANTGAGTFEILGQTSNGTYTSGGFWTPATILIQDVSVHHSYNKCYVVHETANANFYNNVCVRTVGQGMYLEDGNNITGNQFMRNHIAGTMAALTTYSFPQANQSKYWDGDNLQGYYYSTTGQPWSQNNNWYNVNNVPDTSASGANANPVDSTHPGGFWITNLANTFVNNSVAGCQGKGRGYWLLAQGSTNNGYPEFTGNRVHGCYNGIDNDDTTGNTQQPYPMVSSTAQYAPVLLLTDNTITRSRNKAAWFRNWYATLHNHRFATNLRGFSLLVGGGPEGTFPGFWSLVYQNVIAGMTRNNVERYPDCKNLNQNWQTECTDVSGPDWGNYPSTNTNIQGYSYYDGPARIEHNRFVNFRFDPTGLHPNDPAARLLTKTDINNINTPAVKQGQLEGIINQNQAAANAAPSANYQGYVGDVANGWQTSNAQTVPPTQYIRDSIWDNVDFKHQVYTEAVNMGPFNDGDKTTVIRDLDSQLSGLRVVDGSGSSHHDIVPISLNSVDYFATDYTVDEPHSRGPNDFRATSLMSPHKYATLNIESVTNPPYGGGACPSTSSPYIPTCFRVEIKRDMPVYGDTVYPSLFLNGRGQLPIYEPFVMDRMGYMVYGAQGTENYPPYTPTAFQDRLLFSYTDPAVKKTGEFFVNRIAVYQSVTTPANIAMYRIHRQWGGQLYGSSLYPPNFNAPGGAGNTCDGIFSQNQGSGVPTTKWNDCVNRASKAGGMTIPAATSWSQFEQPYQNLMKGTITVSQFISQQTFYYDTTSKLLYFYMIEDQPVQKQYSPYGTCNAAKYSDYVTQIQGIKAFSDPHSVQTALDASCLVSGGAPQHNDLFVCHETGCAAYLVDFSTAGVTTPSAQAPPQTITNVSYTESNPIVITSSAPAPPTGTQVLIAGVQGITNANGQWTVTNTGSNTFSLNNSTGNGSYTTGGTWTCVHCAPPHPISRTDYRNWNQYHLVYGTPAQQPNGLPVVANPAVGNTAPPTDGTALPAFKAPVDGTAPPTGNNITYDFLPLSGGPNGGGPFPVTENFRYHCVATLPWAPVNARGTYPPTGGFTYPLAPSVCAP